MLTLTYKGENFKIVDIFNLFILSDITFTLIIFIWYILYIFNIFTYFSPFFALVLTLIQNIFIISFLIKNKKINISNAFKYILVLVILKVIPILSFYPNKMIIHIRDIFFIFYLYAFYILFLIILVDLFDLQYDIKKMIYADFSGENIDKSPQTKIYDLSYESLVTVLFNNNNSISN